MSIINIDCILTEITARQLHLWWFFAAKCDYKGVPGVSSNFWNSGSSTLTSWVVARCFGSVAAVLAKCQGLFLILFFYFFIKQMWTRLSISMASCDGPKVAFFSAERNQVDGQNHCCVIGEVTLHSKKKIINNKTSSDFAYLPSALKKKK